MRESYPGISIPRQDDRGAPVQSQPDSNILVRNYKGPAESEGEGGHFHFAACLPFAS